MADTQPSESILDPEREIVDAHHHLMDAPGKRYLMEELQADVDSGHRVIATVYIECGSMYRAAGPPAMRPLGETEFATGVAAMSASGQYSPARLCAGIVGHVDLTDPAHAAAVIERHQQIAGARFCGLRQISFWDESEAFYDYALRRPPRGLLLDKHFRAGFRHLAAAGLSFDSCLLFHQIDELADLADHFPEMPIILDHLGFPLGIGPYAARREEVFDQWRNSLKKLAERPNTYIKIGGLGLPVFGFDFHQRREAVHSAELATAWAPYVESAVAAFGTRRSMFESNFPEDRRSCDYAQLWNAFKRIAARYSESEKQDLFKNTAQRAYGLRLDRD